MNCGRLTSPALVVDSAILHGNVATMSAALPGSRLRPHVKAHKTTALAGIQAEAGHLGFTCATVREVEGMARAGFGQDLLLANEVLDARRLGAVVDSGARVTVAVDSPETVEAAATGGVPEVVIDIDVGLSRCGCRPEAAGFLADLARGRGIGVRGVMGYEGHLMLLPDATERERRTAECMSILRDASSVVGGEVVSAGGTGTYALNRWASEIQAGSYLLMDTAYHALGVPFGQALAVLGTVISTAARWAVADVGLKALGMNHGNPTIAGADVVFCSDEHVTFTPRPGTTVRVGDRVRVLPAHIDPTMALHERIHLLEGDEVVDTWPIDLRGW